jgi:UBA-like domain
MADHDQLIAQLTSMTGMSTEKAQFYLEMSNWDINVCKIPAIAVRSPSFLVNASIPYRVGCRQSIF